MCRDRFLSKTLVKLTINFTMPHTARSHEECRRAVCLLCFGKTKEMREISEKTRDIICDYFIEAYDMTDPRMPAALCSNCRRVVREYSMGTFSSEIELFDYSKVLAHPTTRSSPKCSCLICETARTTLQAPKRDKPGRPSAARGTSSELRRPVKLCEFCLSVIHRGKAHSCTPGTRHKNIVTLSTDSPSSKPAEKVASSLMKPGGSSASLATTSGRPLHVKLVPESQKEQRSQISSDDMGKIKTSLNLSTNQTLKLASHIRAATSNRKIIQPNLKDSLHELSHKIDNFFLVEESDFTVNASDDHHKAQLNILSINQCCWRETFNYYTKVISLFITSKLTICPPLCD